MNMVENHENALKEEIVGANDSKVSELQFTGNWFIDAGILGFVNLMEEVYGWDLEELKRRIEENQEIVYYGNFLLASVFKNLYRNNAKLPLNIIEELENTLWKNHFNSSQEIFDFVWDNYVCKVSKDKWVHKKLEVIDSEKTHNKKGVKAEFNDDSYIELIKEREELLNSMIGNKEYDKDLKKILKKKKVDITSYEDIKKLVNIEDTKKFHENFISDVINIKNKNSELQYYLNSIWEKDVEKEFKFEKDKSRFYRIPIDSGFYKNFLFFNYGKGHYEQKQIFYNTINFNFKDEEKLRTIDKTLNKLLASESEFSNISYTYFSSSLFKQTTPYLFIYFLCFIYSFQGFGYGVGNVLFYSNDLKFSYIVNKRLKIRKTKAKNSNSLFKITWREIVDLIIEFKSEWSLENMYIIKYSRLDNQAQQDIEYIGIPKLQASIILDDDIRDSLNKNLQIRSGKNSKYFWILEEFIKNRPLFHLILSHVIMRANKQGNKVSKMTLLYSLSADAQIKVLNMNCKNRLFGKEFFDEYSDKSFQIKESYKWMNLASQNVSKIFSQDKKDKIIHKLISTMKRQNKHAFVNILLKTFIELEQKDPKLVKHLNNYIFNNIVQNEEIWQNYALAMIVGLL